MKRLILLLWVLSFIPLTYCFSERYALQFKDGNVIEGNLVDQDDVTITIKLDSDKNLSYYKVLLNKLEPSTDYHNRLGDNFYKAEKYTEAVKEYEKVLQLDSKNDHAHKQITAINKWYASQHMEKQSKQNEIADALLFSQGMSYYRDMNYDLASSKFKEALTYNANDTSAAEYLRLASQKAAEIESEKVKNEKELEQSEKTIKQAELNDVTGNSPATPAPAVTSPVNPAGRPGGPSPTDSGIHIDLYSITGTGDSATAILHVTSGTLDRELRLKQNDLDSVGNYRVRATNVDTVKNEVTVEILQKGSSVGYPMTLTPTPDQ